MKTQSAALLLLPFFVLFAGFFTLQAQENPSKIVLIQKVVHDDGTETIIKKSVSLAIFPMDTVLNPAVLAVMD